MNLCGKKPVIPAVFIIIALIAAFSGCFSNWKDEEATITINLGTGTNARAVSDYPPDEDTLLALEHRIILTGPTGTREHTLSKGELNAAFSVAAGNWEITVEALLDGALYATGSSGRVNIIAGKNNPITVKMRQYITYTVEENVITFSVSEVNYINDGQTALTPLVDDDNSYDEKSATFTVTVGGFIEKEDADSVEILCRFDAGSGLESSGLFAANGIFYPATNTKIFTVRVKYDGTTPCASGEADIEIWPDKLPTTASYADYSGGKVTKTILIADGLTEVNSIPVRQGNITHFNTYARTTAGLSKHYKLIESVVLTAPALGTNNWMPIGETGLSFTGTFDGNDNEISGLSITGSSYYIGIFGYVAPGGVVKNLTVTGSVEGDSYVGGIVGISGGTVEYCISSVAVTGNNSVGGVVGSNESTGQVLHCSASGSITSSGNSNVGGVVGENQYLVMGCSFTGASVTAASAQKVGGVVGCNTESVPAIPDAGVENCYATGNVTGQSNVGGVVGENYTTVKNCWAAGDVTGSAGYIGGVVGENIGEDSKIEKSYYTTGTVSGINYVGGVAGRNAGTVTYCYAKGTVIATGNHVGGVVGGNNKVVENCYATGNVTGSGDVSGVVGWLNSSASPLQYCYATGNVTGSGEVGGVVGFREVGIAVEYCVALNQSVTTTQNSSNYLGRVVGNIYNGPLTSNYARSDMTVQYNTAEAPSNKDVANSATGFDGADVAASQYNSQAFWQGTMGWDITPTTTSVWKWGSNSLPDLNGMPESQE